MVKGSHDPSKPSFRESTQAEYSALYGRVEEAFEPEDMDRDALEEWLRNSELADQFSFTKDVNDRLEKATTIQEIRNLRRDINSLVVHKKTLRDKADEKIRELEILAKEEKIAVTVATVEGFAEEKGITLSEKTYGNIYEKWGRWGKPAIVIFENGHFKTWRYLTDQEIKNRK